MKSYPLLSLFASDSSLKQAAEWFPLLTCFPHPDPGHGHVVQDYPWSSSFDKLFLKDRLHSMHTVYFYVWMQREVDILTYSHKIKFCPFWGTEKVLLEVDPNHALIFLSCL